MPLESIYLTPARLSRILFLLSSTSPRIALRRATLPSPILTAPLRSRIVTSPAWRSLTSSSAIIFLLESPISFSLSLTFFAASQVMPTNINDKLKFVEQLLFKAVEGLGFAIVHVKDSQQLGDGQQILKLLGQ